MKFIYTLPLYLSLCAYQISAADHHQSSRSSSSSSVQSSLKLNINENQRRIVQQKLGLNPQNHGALDYLRQLSRIKPSSPVVGGEIAALLAQKGSYSNVYSDRVGTFEEYADVIRSIAISVKSLGLHFDWKSYLLNDSAGLSKNDKMNRYMAYAIARYYVEKLQKGDIKNILALANQIEGEINDKANWKRDFGDKVAKAIAVYDKEVQKELENYKIQKDDSKFRIYEITDTANPMTRSESLGENVSKLEGVLIPEFDRNNRIVSLETPSERPSDTSVYYIEKDTDGGKTLRINQQYSVFGEQRDLKDVMAYKFIIRNGDNEPLVYGFIPRDLSTGLPNELTDNLVLLSQGKEDEIAEVRKNILYQELSHFHGGIYPVQKLISLGKELGNDGPINEFHAQLNQSYNTNIGGAPYILRDAPVPGFDTKVYTQAHRYISFTKEGFTKISDEILLVNLPDVDKQRQRSAEIPDPITLEEAKGLARDTIGHFLNENKTIKYLPVESKYVRKSLGYAGYEEQDELFVGGHEVGERSNLPDYASARKEKREISHLTSLQALKVYLDTMSSKEKLRNSEFYLIKANKEAYLRTTPSATEESFDMMHTYFYAPEVLFRFDKTTKKLYRMSVGLLSPQMGLTLDRLKERLGTKHGVKVDLAEMNVALTGQK